MSNTMLVIGVILIGLSAPLWAFAIAKWSAIGFLYGKKKFDELQQKGKNDAT